MLSGLLRCQSGASFSPNGLELLGTCRVVLAQHTRIEVVALNRSTSHTVWREVLVPSVCKAIDTAARLTALLSLRSIANDRLAAAWPAKRRLCRRRTTSKTRRALRRTCCCTLEGLSDHGDHHVRNRDDQRKRLPQINPQRHEPRSSSPQKAQRMRTAEVSQAVDRGLRVECNATLHGGSAPLAFRPRPRRQPPVHRC